MTLFTQSSGQRVLKASSRIDSASDTTLYAASEKRFATIESVWVSLSAAGSSTVSIWVTNGTTDYYLVEDATVGASSSFSITDHNIPLVKDWSLKCRAGTAGRVDVTAVLIESNPTMPR